jgi:hypothetical protein
MPGLYRLSYYPDGPTHDLAGSRGNYYEFPDGTRLDMETTPAWCYQCNGISEGEEIMTLEEIDQKLADLGDPASELYRFTMRNLFEGIKGLEDLQGPQRRDEFRLQLITEARRRRAWRETRSSPPKCIRCGSTNIFLYPVNRPAPNPAGPGTVELTIVGMCSTSFNEWFFTPEGDRIPRDTKPTYWHHPALDESPRAVQGFLRRITRRLTRFGKRDTTQ